MALALGLLSVADTPRAHAISIELKTGGADRIERQRAAEAGRLPLPGTPATEYLDLRLAAQGLKSGSPVLIRIFKAESEFEIWMEKEGSYVHFATYPICNWSGVLGAKTREGDKQTPEGFYTITARQLHRRGRWPRALNLGYPNIYDKAHDRHGSYILVHGGCSSVGCFAMTNTVIGEIYALVAAALKGGQQHVPVHVFPFRMTDENLVRYDDGEWRDFWLNLKEGHDSFERTRLVPRISVCEGRYHVRDGNIEEPVEMEPAPSHDGHDGMRAKAPHLRTSGPVREQCPKPRIDAAVDRPVLAQGPSSSNGVAVSSVVHATGAADARPSTYSGGRDLQ